MLVVNFWLLAGKFFFVCWEEKNSVEEDLSVGKKKFGWKKNCRLEQNFVS